MCTLNCYFFKFIFLCSIFYKINKLSSNIDYFNQNLLHKLFQKKIISLSLFQIRYQKRVILV